MAMKMLMPTVVLGGFLFLACSAAFAQGGIYKWTDAKGSPHFSNTPTREAEVVDDLLPPASNFGRQTEPPLPAIASTEPVPQAPVPPAEANEPPPSEYEAPPPASEPPIGEPRAAESPGLPAAGPFAGPVPAAVGAQPAPVEPDESAEGESETE
ncbi:MAG: DUF4124 domain-containing protein [Deltaproteobacteria bacterium]|nr:DUF4124 domain-containing protein [Deltaproteobacteria bacterium]